MEFLLNRYRNLSVLLVAILAQLALLAYQIKSSQDIRLIRVWAVTAVTPLARVIEAGRSGASYFFHDYFALRGVREENRRIKAELELVEMDNQYLRAELSTADRAEALKIFQANSRSKTLAAHVIGNTTDTGAKVIFVDRGSADKIQKGFAVITPEGIVGKVITVFATASYVLLVTDPSFAAGVVSQKHHVHGTLKGQVNGTVTVDYIQNEETVEPGEWFLTSGDDLIFPRGLPAGQASVVRDGRNHKEVYLTPSGLQNGLEDVLIVIEGVHGTIPDATPPDQPVQLLAPPGPEGSPDAAAPAQSGGRLTDLDRATQNTRAIGDAQHHVFGDKNSPAPNYNLSPGIAPPPSTPADPAHSAAPSPRP
jgi:rod shape-determining protein MreC